MTGKQKKVLMAAVAVIKQYIGNNHEAMCSLKDLLCQIDMEEVFDVDSIDPMADLKEKVFKRHQTARLALQIFSMSPKLNSIIHLN